MTIIYLLAYPAIRIIENGFPVIKTSPMDPLGKQGEKVFTLNDIRSCVEAFGEAVSKQYPDISFAVSIVFPHGQRKLRGFDEARRSGRLSTEKWIRTEGS